MSNRTIILLSDMHIGLRPKESRRTKIIFDRIADSFPGAPVIITGDLTDSATGSQFREMRRFLRWTQI